MVTCLQIRDFVKLPCPSFAERNFFCFLAECVFSRVASNRNIEEDLGRVIHPRSRLKPATHQAIFYADRGEFDREFDRLRSLLFFADHFSLNTRFHWVRFKICANQ